MYLYFEIYLFILKTHFGTSASFRHPHLLKSHMLLICFGQNLLIVSILNKYYNFHFSVNGRTSFTMRLFLNEYMHIFMIVFLNIFLVSLNKKDIQNAMFDHFGLFSNSKFGLVNW